MRWQQRHVKKLEHLRTAAFLASRVGEMSTVSNALVRSQRKILHLKKSLRERCNRLNGECGNSKNGWWSLPLQKRHKDGAIAVEMVC